MAYVDKENVILNFGNDISDAFVCDAKISDTIITLNQKGYVTSESCSGHSDRIGLDPNVDFWEEGRNVFPRDNGMALEEQIKKLKLEHEKKKSGIRLEVNNVSDKEIKFVTLYERTRVYVFFPKTYKVPPLDGFQVDNYGNFTIVQKWIFFRRPNGCFKSHDEIEKELVEANAKLLSWAKQLPSLDKDITEDNIKNRF